MRMNGKSIVADAIRIYIRTARRLCGRRSGFHSVSAVVPFVHVIMTFNVSVDSAVIGSQNVCPPTSHLCPLVVPAVLCLRTMRQMTDFIFCPVSGITHHHHHLLDPRCADRHQTQNTVKASRSSCRKVADRTKQSRKAAEKTNSAPCSQRERERDYPHNNMLQMMAEGGGRTGQRRRRCRLIQVASESRCLWMWLLMAFSQKKHNGLVAVMGFPPCYKQIISTTATASFPGTTTTRSSGIRLFLSSEQENPSPKKSRFSNKKSNKPYNFWEEKLSITAFNMDLHNLAMEDAEKAQDALEIMEGLYSQEPDNPHYVQPDSASYTTVIEGWCYGNHYEDAPQRSQALLDIMESKPHLAPNELTYLLVCQKWAESYKADVAGANAQKAHAILLGLKLKNKNPSTKLYSIVLEGWCRRVGKVPRAMNRAEELLCEMEESGGVSRPNVLTYTSVIGGLARSNEHDLATRADAMLKRMQQNGVESDMVAYTSVLNCWGKAVSRVECEQASSRALEILKTMEDSYTKEENYHVKPNAITYATAIKAIGNSLNPEAHILAENILRHMYNLTETGTIHVPPSVGTYNAVITSLSTRCPKSNRLSNARRAEHLLVDMIKRTRNGESLVEPNVRTWGAVLRAWADSGQPDSGEQAQRVLDLLEQWYEEGKTAVRPNVVCYTTVMSAWGRGNASPKIALDNVERILKKMETIYEETLDLDVRPNKITYVTAIDVFTRKCKNNSASRAQGVVERMMQLYSKGVGFDRPTRIIFNALVNAWSRSNEENAAANAEKIFRWMESQYRSGDNFVKPDEV